MDKQLVFFIVKKYLKFDKTNPFISIIALLAFTGVAIGVMVLMIAMAIMNGTQKEFENKLFAMNYPITIYPILEPYADQNIILQLEQRFPNMTFAPFVSTQAILQNNSAIGGAMVFGVDFKKETKINEVLSKAIAGQNIQNFEMVIGESLFDDLGILSNQKITAHFTSNSPTALSAAPKLKRFFVQKTFKSGLQAYDKSFAYTDLDSLRAIMELESNQITAIHVGCQNPKNEISKLNQFVKDYNLSAVGWWEQNGNFFSAMELEKKALFVVLMLIILIASLNIISSLLMSVMSRRKEIALLLSLGASKTDVHAIFFYLGLIIGFGGVIFGIVLGFSGILVLDVFDIISLPADVYGTSKLPLDLSIFDFLSIVIGASFIVFVSSYYPAKKATKIDVLNVLRNE